MNIICITNRKLCQKDFLIRLEEIAKASPKAIVLREKDLSEDEYMSLASDVMNIGERYNVPVYLHYFYDVAKKLGANCIHLPLWKLDEEGFSVSDFSDVGVSCHSIEDAKKAVEYGCSYIFAGHIFDTDCKRGLPGRGLSFLKNVCDSVDIPVYAIGGINSENAREALRHGASGVCIMSGLMQCENVRQYMDSFRS